MSGVTRGIRKSMELQMDTLEMSSFNEGFEAALDSIEELSDQKHNNHELIFAEHLRWTAKELRGENAN